MISDGHTPRRSKIDDLISSTGNTPRSNSWGREHDEAAAQWRLTQSARSPRSKSMSRARTKELEDEEKERRENAEAAFREWLKRKTNEPRTPRASPTRDQISRHLKDEARQKVINQWHNNKRFQKHMETLVTNQRLDRKNLNDTF